MKRLILISGDGSGAGKTHAARLFGHVHTIADSIRRELSALYPYYQWFNRDQNYKDSVLVPEYRADATVRDVLYEYGQSKCVDDPCYWVESCGRTIELSHSAVITIDDVRKVCELDYLLQHFGDERQVIHVHIDNPDAKREPQFENEALRARADYVMRWKK